MASKSGPPSSFDEISALGRLMAVMRGLNLIVIILFFQFGGQDQFAADSTTFPNVKSKKGLQVQMVDDALALGVKHAALNLNFALLLDVTQNGDSHKLKLGGQVFHFKRGYVQHLDSQIKKLSDEGIVVSLILLYYRSGNAALDKIMLHPQYDPACPNNLSAFNTSSDEAARHFRACMEFLAQRYSSTDSANGRVWNYILGNEVNSHWFWSNMGRVTMEEFADDYLRALRISHGAIRKYSDHARLYVSLEHHWNIRYPGGEERQAFAARPFLEYLSGKAKEAGDFDWHVAFHPYPENLFECRTWNDKSATYAEDTPRITFKNLEMLPQFLSKKHMLYKGKPRRVILSEQGFHTPDTPEGEKLQASAYCYAYVKTARLDSIDSFILHRHVDHGHEGGLNLGIWTRNKQSSNAAEPLKKKLLYEVFQKADTSDWERAFEFALPVIGIKSWDEIFDQPR